MKESPVKYIKFQIEKKLHISISLNYFYQSYPYLLWKFFEFADNILRSFG